MRVQVPDRHAGSAGVAPEVKLKSPLHTGRCIVALKPRANITRGHHQKRDISGPTNSTHVLQKLKNKGVAEKKPT